MSRHIGYPAPGCYVIRLVRKGPLVPMVIFEDGQPPEWLGFDEGAYRRTLVPGIGFLCFFIPNLTAHRDLMDLWPGTRPITQAECLYLIQDAAWQADFNPDGPLANPLRPVAHAGLDLEP